MAVEDTKLTDKKTVGCRLSSAAIMVGAVAASIAAGIAFGPQCGFAIVGAVSIWAGLRFAWATRKIARGKEDGHGR